MTGGPGGAALGELDAAAWLQALDEIGEERGYFEPLGERHSAIFTDENPVLLVTFETVASVRARPDSLPLGFELAKKGNWSQLTLLADGDTWFRDRRVYGFFDRLIDDGFFEDFDRVIFYGEGMCGYAACAFSVAAPGCTVLAVQPQATLDPLRAGWDARFRTHRRLNFTDRYGFAPQMVEAAEAAFVLYDPYATADAIHAAFFTSENARLIRCRNLSSDVGGALQRLDRLQGLLDRAAGPEGLHEIDIYRALRARSRYAPYLRMLVGRLENAQNWMRMAKVTRALTARFGGRRFGRIHAEAMSRLEAEGRSLPPRRTAPPTAG